jgi:hypothetical protein
LLGIMAEIKCQKFMNTDIFKKLLRFN